VAVKEPPYPLPERTPDGPGRSGGQGIDAMSSRMRAPLPYDENKNARLPWARKKKTVHTPWEKQGDASEGGNPLLGP
jgi:hypothetical protein